MTSKMCPRYNDVVKVGHLSGDESVDYFDAFVGVRPTGIKRIKVQCPECGRRLMSSVSCCHDGCCVYHRLPRHKRKGWWKPIHRQGKKVKKARRKKLA